MNPGFVNVLSFVGVHILLYATWVLILFPGWVLIAWKVKILRSL